MNVFVCFVFFRGWPTEGPVRHRRFEREAHRGKDPAGSGYYQAEARKSYRGFECQKRANVSVNLNYYYSFLIPIFPWAVLQCHLQQQGGK